MFFIIGFLVYFNALFGEFVWDDFFLFVRNVHAQKISGAFFFFSPNAYIQHANQSPEGFYRPLMHVYFSFVWSITHGSFLFHVFQVSLHIINAILVFKLLKLFTKERIAFCLGLVFLLHPMNVEAVAYISATQDTLYFTLGMIALLILIHRTHKKIHLILASLLLLFSLLVRESGIQFILIFILYGMLFQKTNLVKSIFVGAAVFLVYIYMRVGVAKVIYFKEKISPIMELSLQERMMSMPKIIFHYIYTFTFPLKLHTSQMWIVEKISFFDFYLPLFVNIVFVIAIILGLIYLLKTNRKEARSYLFFLAWFVFGIGLFLQIIPLDFTVTERWFYFPMVGLLGMIGVSVKNIAIQNKKTKTGLIIIFVFLLILFSLRVIVRNIDWQTPFKLYSSDILYSPESFDLNTNLGVEYGNKGETQTAIAYTTRSVEHAPYNFVNFNNLGVLYAKKNDFEKSEYYFKKSLAESENYYPAYYNFAYSYVDSKNYKEARLLLERALRKFPESSELWVLLGEVEYRLDNKKGALKAVKQAHLINPSDYTKFLYESVLYNRPIN